MHNINVFLYSNDKILYETVKNVLVDLVDVKYTIKISSEISNLNIFINTCKNAEDNGSTQVILVDAETELEPLEEFIKAELFFQSESIIRFLIYSSESKYDHTNILKTVTFHSYFEKPVSDTFFQQSLHNLLLLSQTCTSLSKFNIKLFALLEITKVMIYEKDINRLLTYISTQACNVLQADRATIFIADNERHELFARVHLKENQEIRIPMGSGIAGFVFETGKVVNIPDPYKDNRFNPAVDKATGYKTNSILCSPIRDMHNHIIGVIQLLNKKEGPFDQQDEYLLTAFGAHSAVAIKDAFLQREMSKTKEMKSYLPKSLVKKIDSEKRSEFAVGERREVTVLFSDIRGFTKISEKYNPELVVKVLNQYFSAMEKIISDNEGEIDKFIGDALFAVFYHSNKAIGAKSAILSAIEMMLKLEQLNRMFKKQNTFELKIGVGINTGEVITGNIGSRMRRDYTSIGDAVNTAARLEKESKTGNFTKIFISDETFKLCNFMLDVESRTNKIRGKKDDVKFHEIIKIKLTDEILLYLQTAKDENKLKIISFLAQRKDSRVVKSLLPFLKHLDDEVRTQTLHSLHDIGKNNFPDNFEVIIIDIIKNDTSDRARSSAISILGTLDCEIPKDLLESLMKDQNPRIRANTLDIVRIKKNQYIMTKFYNTLTDDNSRIRINAALAVCELDLCTTLNCLIQTIKTPEEQMQVSAIWGIKQIGKQFDPETGQFSKLLKDKDEEVKNAARSLMLDIVNILEELILVESGKKLIQAIDALGTIGLKKSTDALIKLVHKSNSHFVYDNVLLALKNIGAEDTLLMLVSKLKEVKENIH